jgi:hypothetical protein
MQFPIFSLMFPICLLLVLITSPSQMDAVKMTKSSAKTDTWKQMSIIGQSSKFQPQNGHHILVKRDVRQQHQRQQQQNRGYGRPQSRQPLKLNQQQQQRQKAMVQELSQIRRHLERLGLTANERRQIREVDH